eukprot:scaffold182067_cov69-Attheya_sp.AAC.1
MFRTRSLGENPTSLPEPVLIPQYSCCVGNLGQLLLHSNHKSLMDLKKLKHEFHPENVKKKVEQSHGHELTSALPS